MSRLKVALFEDKLWVFRSGIDTAFRHQQKALRLVGVEVTTELAPTADAVHINWYTPLSWWVLQQAKRRGQKVVVVAHTGNDIEGNVGGTRAMRDAIKRYVGRLYSSADMVVAVSEYLKDTLKAPPFGVTAPMVVIHNGVDRECFRFSEENRKKARARLGVSGPVVACVAQVLWRKGVRDFLEVARRMPEVRFLWFGPMSASWLSNGFEMSRLMRRKPENVTFTGFVEDIEVALAAADVFFFPSHEENQAIAVCEAASLGLPLVARPLPAYKGWLLDRPRAAALFATDNEGFVEAIERLLDDRTLRTEIVQEGLKVAEENDLCVTGQRFLDAYRDILHVGDD